MRLKRWLGDGGKDYLEDSVTKRNIAEQTRTMSEKFEKRENCEYCEKPLEAVYRSKRFCGDKCRIYWNRENKKPQPTPEVKKDLSEKKVDLSEKKVQYPKDEKHTTSQDVLQKIADYEAELPTLGTGIIAKQRKRFIENRLYSLRQELQK